MHKWEKPIKYEHCSVCGTAKELAEKCNQNECKHPQAEQATASCLSELLDSDADCVWNVDTSDEQCWNTGCNDNFIIYEGTPEENGMRFCPYCGKKLTTV